jgi:DNA adenine methylase
MLEVNKDKITPLLKWVGGKRELIPEIKKYYSDLKFNNYYEPFFGGGSVYIDIINTFGEEKISKSYINDINEDLINLIRDVKTKPREIIDNLHKLKKDYEEFGYYHIRDRFNGVDREKQIVDKYIGVERSSSLIVLNRTCFNGLYRTNKKGLFNVPTGKYSNPKIINENNIINLSEILPPLDNILNLDFNDISTIEKNDLVYFDPPYHPLNETSSFTEYSGSFGQDKQIELFNFFKHLDDKGVFVILSNSSSDFILNLYKEYNPFSVLCSRNINSKGDGRGKIKEVLVIGNSLRKRLKLLKI